MSVSQTAIHSVSLSTSQSASQPASQSVSQQGILPVIQSACQPAKQPVSQSVSVCQPASQPASQPVSQSVSQPARQPVCQLFNLPVSQPNNQSVCLSVNQPVGQSISESVCRSFILLISLSSLLRKLYHKQNNYLSLFSKVTFTSGSCCISPAVSKIIQGMKNEYGRTWPPCYVFILYNECRGRSGYSLLSGFCEYGDEPSRSNMQEVSWRTEWPEPG
jgi:hypothetical protein